MAKPLTKEEVEAYLGKVDLRGPLEEALNVAVSNLTMDPVAFLSGHFAASKLARELGILPTMVGPCDGLLPQPVQGASYTLILVEYNIPGHESGVGAGRACGNTALSFDFPDRCRARIGGKLRQKARGGA